MPNRFGVIDESKVIKVEARLRSTPKGIWVRQMTPKSPTKPVRGNKKKAASTSQKPVSNKGNSLPQPSDSWPDDPPLLMFDPELESAFDSKAHTKARFLFVSKISFRSCYISVPA
jgi:hypothetical protein